MPDEKLALTIFLFKRERAAEAEKELSELGPPAIALRAPYDGFVVSFPATPNIPQWLVSLKTVVDDPDSVDGAGSSPSAIMVVRQDGNTFALSFGRAYHRLKSEWLQSDFGLKVALNGIKPSKVVEIHAEQVFAKWHKARERAPRAASVGAFGVEFDRDLVGSIEGESATKVLGPKILGGESLRIEASFATFPSILEKAATLFKSRSYRDHWPEIDNLEEVANPDTTHKLESKLDTVLKGPNAQREVVMFTPTRMVEEAAAIDSYVLGLRLGNPASSPYLQINGWKSLLERRQLDPSAAQARATAVHFLDAERQPIRKANVFDCFGFETDFNGKTYVLSGGIWYLVAANFLAGINKEVSHIPAPTIRLLAWNGAGEREAEYNERCGAVAGFTCFDREILRYGGGQSQFEFCDILHLESRTLYFVKSASRSDGMSHLYEQVRRTTEMLFSVDDGYRKELIPIVRKKRGDVDWLKSRPKQGEWNICLVSLDRDKSALPFFARCGLAKLLKGLQRQGHSVFYQSA
jgi:uncharacterized protein (TIGR04141 family)